VDINKSRAYLVSIRAALGINGEVLENLYVVKKSILVAFDDLL